MRSRLPAPAPAGAAARAQLSVAFRPRVAWLWAVVGVTGCGPLPYDGSPNSKESADDRLGHGSDIGSIGRLDERPAVNDEGKSKAALHAELLDNPDLDQRSIMMAEAVLEAVLVGLKKQRELADNEPEGSAPQGPARAHAAAGPAQSPGVQDSRSVPLEPESLSEDQLRPAEPAAPPSGPPSIDSEDAANSDADSEQDADTDCGSDFSSTRESLSDNDEDLGGNSEPEEISFSDSESISDHDSEPDHTSVAGSNDDPASGDELEPDYVSASDSGSTSQNSSVLTITPAIEPAAGELAPQSRWYSRWRSWLPSAAHSGARALGVDRDSIKARLMWWLPTFIRVGANTLGINAQDVYTGVQALFTMYQTTVVHRFDDSAVNATLLPSPAAQRTLPTLSFDGYVHTLAAAMANPQAQSRQHFYDSVWQQQICALLPQEEAALQLWAHTTAYMYHQPDMVVPLAIRGQWSEALSPTWPDGQTVVYAQENKIVNTHPAQMDCAQNGHPAITALMTLPVGDAAGPAIIVFRGTQPAGGDVLTRLHPSGLQADVDAVGVGHDAFAHHKQLLHGWVAQAHDSGRKVVLVGHSLGGTLAIRLMASLSPTQQMNTRLLAFAPAGVESEVAAQIVYGNKNVVTILDSLDPVPSVGTNLPPGSVIETGFNAELSGTETSTFWEVLWANHTFPSLAMWQLGWRPNLQARVWSSPRIGTDPMGFSEMIRTNVLAAFYHSYARVGGWESASSNAPQLGFDPHQ